MKLHIEKYKYLTSFTQEKKFSIGYIGESWIGDSSKKCKCIYCLMYLSYKQSFDVCSTSWLKDYSKICL